MTRLSLLTLATLAGGALPALAQGPHAWISDPRGCAPYAGVGGDGAARHAMTQESVLLDHEVLEAAAFYCSFATPFRLSGRPGEYEEREAICQHEDGRTVERRLEAHYEAADRITLSASDQTLPLYFQRCPLD